LRNQPKYNFFKNTSYALSGLKDIFATEKSFKIEAIIVVLLSFFLWAINLDFYDKLLLFCAMFFVLIAEAINSAIERVVDLVTKEYHPMARRAKDVGSSIVFLSISLAVVIWLSILYLHFNKIF
jgi:diacylglycerol kinase (ATP)